MKRSRGIVQLLTTFIGGKGVCGCVGERERERVGSFL